MILFTIMMILILITMVDYTQVSMVKSPVTLVSTMTPRRINVESDDHVFLEKINETRKATRKVVSSDPQTFSESWKKARHYLNVDPEKRSPAAIRVISDFLVQIEAFAGCRKSARGHNLHLDYHSP